MMKSSVVTDEVYVAHYGSDEGIRFKGPPYKLLTKLVPSEI